MAGAPRGARASATHLRAPPRKRRWPALGHGRQGGGPEERDPKGPARPVAPAGHPGLARLPPSGGTSAPPAESSALSVLAAWGALAGAPRCPVPRDDSTSRAGGTSATSGPGLGSRALSLLPSGRRHAAPSRRLSSTRRNRPPLRISARRLPPISAYDTTQPRLRAARQRRGGLAINPGGPLPYSITSRSPWKPPTPSRPFSKHMRHSPAMLSPSFSPYSENVMVEGRSSWSQSSGSSALSVVTRR